MNHERETTLPAIIEFRGAEFINDHTHGTNLHSGAHVHRYRSMDEAGGDAPLFLWVESNGTIHADTAAEAEAYGIAK